AGWLRRVAPAKTSVQQVLLWKHASGDVLDAGVPRNQTQAAIAPHGESIVFSDSVGPTSQLFLKPRDQVAATPIAGTEGAMSPFFSPDGRWLAFFKANGELRKVPWSGGASVLLATGINSINYVGTWLDDNTIVYLDDGFAVRRVPADGGTPVAVWSQPKGERLDPSSMSGLPGSRGVLFTGCPGNCVIASSIYVLDLRTDSVRVLVKDAAGAWYAPTGQLLYTSRDGGLFAAPFDLGRLAVTSGAVPVLTGVTPGTFALSRSGDALYRPERQAGARSQLVWVARDGSSAPFDSTWQADFEYPALAPDGRTLAVAVRDAIASVWVRRPDGSRWEVSLGGQGTWRPAWRPDGRAFSFVTTEGGADSATATPGGGVYESLADGGTPPRRMLAASAAIWEAEYSHDGAWQLFRTDRGNSLFTVIAARRLEGDTAIRTLLADGHFNTQLALSPDERWLAYSSDASGTTEVYVGSFPDMKVRRIVSQGGGTEPRWAHTGRELFFKSQGQLMSLPVYPGAAFTPGIAHALFSVSGYAAANNRQQYDVSADDKRFLMIRRQEGTGAAEAVLIENFPAVLARSVAR
ncbi:MAG TPA: hypothetical protein VNH46_00730, partial [Gemmatimonadales bacterium]|nr:hypothetical protein [Gemmatimonadales bacterium]